MTIYTLSGVTRNFRGTPLGSVTVDVFDEATETFLGTSTSDSGGNYTVTLTASSTAVFAVGYLVGHPDLSGTTRNDLSPTATSSSAGPSLDFSDPANSQYIGILP